MNTGKRITIIVDAEVPQKIVGTIITETDEEVTIAIREENYEHWKTVHKGTITEWRIG